MHKFKKGDKVVRVGYYHNSEDAFMRKGGVYTVESLAYNGMVKLVNSNEGVYYDDEKFELFEETPQEDFKNMKFRVSSPEHSKQIQKHLFTLGYRWDGESKAGVENTHFEFLYTHSDGRIKYGSLECTFKDPLYKEYTLQEITSYTLVEKKETITIDGKEYYKEDVLKRLAELESLN